MNVLALDTSTNQGGVAVLKNRDLLSRRIWTREKSHSEMLTANIEAALNESGVALKDIDRIAVGKGPGSFTGIRVAINAARTLAYANATPLFSFDTSEILAAGVPVTKTPLITGGNAHKNLIYLSRFEEQAGHWARISGPDALTLKEIEELVTIPHLFVGDAYSEFVDVFPIELKQRFVRKDGLEDFPQPDVLGRLAATCTHKPLGWNELQALYVRSSEAEEKLRERLKNRPD